MKTLALMISLFATGGELGNGRSVIYPIIGIETVRPANWNELESLGALKLFEAGRTPELESYVYFEAAQVADLRSETDLAALVSSRFGETPIQLVDNRDLVFAFAENPSDVDTVKGCAWDAKKNRSLCFSAFAPHSRGRSRAIQVILKNLRFLEAENF
jgi:hypothetical protein